jgi:ParB family chromosome partitioning protein
VSHRIHLLKLPDEIKEQISVNRINVSKAIELTTVPAAKQSEILNQIITKNLTVRQIREVKSLMINESSFDIEHGHANIHSRSLRISKKTSLALKITLARLDNIIEEVHSTIEPENRTEIINFLMSVRLKIHSIIDDTIRFKNSNLKYMR